MSELSLQEYYKSRKAMLDKAVKEFLEKEGLLDVSPTPLEGKRLRGVLAILVCEALGGKPEDALDVAVAIELAHAASLDADDIVDMDTVRRGKPAVWVVKGIVKAAVGTHGLVAAALNIVKKYGFEAVEIFADTYLKMVKGEIRDLTGGFYEAIVGAKTASLWAAAAALGALAARRKDYVNISREYGYATGMAFQIADDIVDTAKLIEQGRILDIIKNPSVTAFLAYLGLETLLRTSPFEVLSKGFKHIEDRMKNLAMEKLDQWVKRAQELATQFPDSKYKKLLEEYPTLAIEMMFMEAGIQL